MVKRKHTQSMAYANILLAAALWGIIGLWNRRLMAAGLSPTSIVMVRNFGGCVLLATIFAIKDRSVFRVQRAHLKYFFGTGIISVVLFTVCYFSCQKIASLAVASILLYTAPSFVVVLSATANLAGWCVHQAMLSNQHSRQWLAELPVEYTIALFLSYVCICAVLSFHHTLRMMKTFRKKGSYL